VAGDDLGTDTFVRLSAGFVPARTAGGRSTGTCFSGKLNHRDVTETLTRVPPGAPWVASPDAPILRAIYSVLLVLFLIAATLQVRGLRAWDALAAGG